VRLFHNLVPYIGANQPLYGLQAVPSSEPDIPYERFEDMAEHYVREMRAVQSTGPYLVVGECRGGVLAFELAHQLHRLGEEVALLALVDAFPWGGPRFRSDLEPVFSTVHRLRILRSHLRTLMAIDIDRKIPYVTQRVRRILQRGRAKTIGRRTQSFDERASGAFKLALKRYQPSFYPGRALLLRASRLPWGISTVRDLGWSGLVAELEIVELPAYFTTTLSEPVVRILAETLALHTADI
jgi:thioesterase domain-containing protein